MKVSRWKKTKKAVTALRQFLSKHMKSDNIKLGKELNQYLWKHGIKNPPHHVKVNVSKDDKGEVKAELFGIKKKGDKGPKKQAKKEEPKKEVTKTKEKAPAKEKAEKK